MTMKPQKTPQHLFVCICGFNYLNIGLMYTIRIFSAGAAVGVAKSTKG